MECEADLSGMEIAYRTGYNPAGMIDVLYLLKTKEPSLRGKSSWYSTHPPLLERINKCRARLKSYSNTRDRSATGKRFRRFQAGL